MRLAPLMVMTSFATRLPLSNEDLPHPFSGWLAGARDAEVGQALALMHRKPGESRMLAALAEEAGVSSVRPRGVRKCV